LLSQHDSIDKVDIVRGTIEATLKSETMDYSELPTLLIENGFQVTLFREEEVNLETAFMSLTKGLVQ
jgi:ABC-2 type transport system ATP-binding protein